MKPKVILVPDDIDERVVANAMTDLDADLLVRTRLRVKSERRGSVTRTDAFVLGCVAFDGFAVMSSPRFGEGGPDQKAEREVTEAVHRLPADDQEDFITLQERLMEDGVRTVAMLMRFENEKGVSFALFRHHSLSAEEAGGLLRCALEAREAGKDGTSIVPHKSSS